MGWPRNGPSMRIFIAVSESRRTAKSSSGDVWRLETGHAVHFANATNLTMEPRSDSIERSRFGPFGKMRLPRSNSRDSGENHEFITASSRSQYIQKNKYVDVDPPACVIRILMA